MVALNPQVAAKLAQPKPVTYVQVIRTPARGPQPRLAQGSGRTTSDPTLPGNAPSLPGYLTDNEYFPNIFNYVPKLRENFLMQLPRGINVGVDGLAALNPTYRAHESAVADRFNHHMRQSFAWQNMGYPPTVRNLLQFKQVEKYQIFSNTLAARPLARNNYFLGYSIDQDIASQIGGGNLGSMGSF